MAANYDLQIDQNEPLNLRVERTAPRLDVNGDPVLDGNGKVIYDPVDMTGWLGHMQVRVNFDRAIVADITQDILGTDGYLAFGYGFFTIYVKQSKTLLMKTGMVYDVFAWPVGGDNNKLMAGTAVVEKAVTKP